MSGVPPIHDRSFLLEGGDIGVLLIHGLTGTPVEMRHLGKGLHQAGFTVYGLQLPGHCGTEADLAATTWHDWYAAVEAAIDTLRTRVGRVFVGGLSMGAVLALHAAARLPDKVAGSLLYGTTLWYDGWSIPWYSVLWRPLINTPLGRNYRFVERPPYGIKDERLRKVVVRNLESGNSADAGLIGLPACCMRELWQLIDEVKQELDSVRSPSLVMHAVDDDVSSVRNAHHVAARVSGSVDLCLLDDCYHMITVDRQRETVIARSAEFLRRHGRSRSAGGEESGGRTAATIAAC